ncbi:Nudix-like NDP and NTP phosphohydrolase YmfB [Thioalkalivibrio nitratireducens DSM 14787]|uniref:Nudix-like NDP and NTP phosphohydrolase YmfB n=1 Tax=Thioalkalivibrio nitratireducens (strain DSM 14787 / UNIQEM 213 / ALEN2) TaxID=1255043 RepID=L0DXY1_THIND|nr:NUDIX domain-containing protein [Thioalkalivibrio nitratireducens]AGA33241.1 Nudix-like NDP and NTP phosphohydrolase YmfB [Thioalkalivibrio nitratireducens DSM 14787]
MTERLRCHVTVAAVIADAGRFLFVEEADGGRNVLNQPAGHLEEGEDLRTAVIREVREETGLDFLPEAWLGCDLLALPTGAVTLRVAFTGRTGPLPDTAARDPAILATHWLTPDQVREWPLRSPLVQRSLERFTQGVRLPLDTVGTLFRAP